VKKTSRLQTSIFRSLSDFRTLKQKYEKGVKALGSSVFAAMINHHISHAIQPQALMDASARAHLPAPTLHMLQYGLNDGIVIVFAVGVAVAAAMLMLSLLPGKARLTVSKKSAGA
jgi:hypothetical protein